MRVQDRAYSVRIIFIKDGKKPTEKRFRCIVARSPQGAITKGFNLSRQRNGSRGDHENYGCEKLSVEVSCLGPVDK